MTMDDLEQSLREALRRQAPSPDLAERVLARVEAERSPARRWWNRLAVPATGWAVVVREGATVGATVAFFEEEKEEVRARVARGREEAEVAVGVPGKLRLSHTPPRRRRGLLPRGR